ncbi:hypothetical protein D3C71_182530 [compost metagenome]
MTSPLYVDESGYTGRQLLDPLQRNFVLASSIIDDATAEAVMRAAFPNYQGSEFKFQTIWARPRSKGRLPFLAEALAPHIDGLYIWQIDKRFALLIKMMDHLMEPTVYDAGHDFYADGYAKKLANYIHFGLTKVARAGLYDEVLKAYYAFARRPSEASRAQLASDLVRLRRTAPQELDFFFNDCLKGLAEFHQHSEMESFHRTLEIYLTSMLNVVGHWTNAGLKDIALHHDESSAFFSQRDQWDALTSPDVPPQLHPVVNGPPISFPLPLASTHSRRSHESPGVQLCDLVAGLAAKVFGALQDGDRSLLDELRNTPFANIDTNGVAPGEDFPDAGPQRRVGKDPVDRMVDIIYAAQRSEE